MTTLPMHSTHQILESPRLVSVFDTSVANANMGNAIIMQAIYQEISQLFPFDFVIKLQYGEALGKTSLDFMSRSSYTFFGGTNSLSSQMNKYSQMGLRLRDTFKSNRLILFGLGWWQYQLRPNLYTRLFLKRLLSNSVCHSVRDEYTLQMLQSIGVRNAINTSCPTTWNLTTAHCSKIATMPARSVITTVTDYHPDPKRDREMIMLLRNRYKTVYVWLQGLGDFRYLQSIGINQLSRIILVPPSLSAYEKLLAEKDLDYVGTRLHAGIKAIQAAKRTLIIAVDNRATEISKDINLNICSRGDLARISEFSMGRYETKLQVPINAISKWRAQFIAS